MASSSLSSLGLGSSGVLSYKIIDKLRAADESGQIKPITTKLTANATKTSDLSILTTMAASFKTSASVLSNEMTYLTRASSTSGSSANITVASGVAVQDFSIDVQNLATRDIYQSKSYLNKTSTFASGNDTLTLSMGTNSFNVDVTTTTTLTGLKDLINNNSNGKVIASILNVGGNTPYKLVIKSTDTGADNAITFSSTSSTVLGDLGLNGNTTNSGNVQHAKDASFLYNGVTINRSSNTVDDLIAGVSIKLNSAGATSVNITQDTKQITSNVSSFVSTYNKLMSNLNESIKYDSTSGNAGTFQGVSQVVSLKSAINRSLMEPDSKGRSIEDYGISLNSAGILEFDQTVYNAKLAADPTGMEEFFRGYTDTTTSQSVDGYFTLLNSTMADYINGNNSVLSLYQTQLDTQKKSLTTQKAKATASLDSKYAIMAKKFAAYDSIISNLNSNFSALDSIIKSQYSNNSSN